MSALARLLEQVTPGPWGAAYWPTPEPTHWVGQRDPNMFSSRMLGPVTGAVAEHDARLIALAPDMARLLIDMAAWVDEILTKPYRVEERWNAGNALLARFAELEQRAAP